MTSGPRNPIFSALALVALLGLGAMLLLSRETDREGEGVGGGNGGGPDPIANAGGNDPSGGDPQTDGTLPDVPTGPTLDAMGRVIDHRTGRGVADAKVTVTAGPDPRVLPLDHAATDPAGFFHCRFADRDPFELTVRAEGYTSARWRIEDGITPAGLPFEIADLELAVAPESIIWIRSEVSEVDPEETIIVEYRLRQPRLPAELGEPLRLQGNVELQLPETRIGGLAAGQYLLSFRTSRQRLQSMEVELGMAEERTLDFVLGPPLPIRGTVRHNGRAVSGGRLLVWGRDQRSSTTAPVDDRGRYRVSLPAPGRFSVSFSPSREFPEDGTGGTLEIDVTDPGIFDLEFRAHRLSGQVIGPDDSPVPHLAGTLFGPQALSFVTDGSGRFEFDGVPEGVYRWLFTQSPPGSFGPGREFSVDRDLDVEYRFEASASLEVIVVRDPEPAPETEVGRPQISLVESEGRITSLRPTGEPNRYHWPREGGLGVVAQRGWAPWFFELGPGDHPTPQTAHLTPGGDLTVTVFTFDGRPAAGQGFRIVGLDAPTLPEEWCLRRTGPRGEARLTLPPGTYRIEADLPGGHVEREIRIHARSSTEARLP